MVRGELPTNLVCALNWLSKLRKSEAQETHLKTGTETYFFIIFLAVDSAIISKNKVLFKFIAL
jgi:hypothetical protein